MKRLLKKADNDFTYKFESPILIDFQAHNGDDIGYNSMLSDETDLISEVASSVRRDMSEMEPEGLAKYIHDNKIKDIIKSIIVSVNSNGNALTTVKAEKELSDEQISALKNYIKGQFSDGWGEGFEQNVIINYDDPEFFEGDEYYDEDADEYFGVDDTTIDIYAHLWFSRNWYLNLI